MAEEVKINEVRVNKKTEQIYISFSSVGNL